jgi:hypothetical protein
MIARQKGTTLEILCLNKLQPKASLFSQNAPNPFEHDGLIKVSRDQNAYAPTMLGGTCIKPFNHVILLAAIGILPGEV